MCTTIMGPSRSGKTTLLDILADRICSGCIKGEIVLNGEKRDEKPFRSVSSYVAQEDSILGSFTVLETLEIAARLTMPSDATAISIIKRVQSVIDDMGLRVRENAMVGDIFHKGISGGQKRRLSIAIEMLSDPSILLLDEPTSGLDSASTYNVVKLISRLGKEGRTVICTIHQPSSQVYEMFTNVMILTAGQTAYFGLRSKIIPHLPSSMQQFYVLLHRNLLNNLRNPGTYWVRLVTYTMLSFMVGTMYLSSNPDSVASDIVMLLIYVDIYLVFLSIAVLPFFIEQRAVFLRERTNSNLDVLIYVVANFLGALPGIFLIALSSTLLVGYLAGLKSYGVFLVVVFLALIVAETLMHLISAVVPQFIIGMALGGCDVWVVILVMDLFVPGEAMPYYWRWAHRLGFLSYSFEALLFNQFGNDSSLESKAVMMRFVPDEVHLGRNMAILVANAAVFEIAFAIILYKFHIGRG